MAENTTTDGGHDVTDQASTYLERIERETPDAHELTLRVIQFADGSRLMALPAAIRPRRPERAYMDILKNIT